MRSFDPDPSVTVTAARGQQVHRRSLKQSARMARRFNEVAPGVWCLVGNGLSNQTFIEGPGGVIAIDTGECVEEMASALTALRAHTRAPIVAVIYTHFHYVGGTRAIFDEAGHAVPVYGHEGIARNMARVSGEIAPAYASGLIHQFGLRLPEDGPDGLVNVGLGAFFRDPNHAPFTPGHIPVTHPWRGGERLAVAGLKVEVTHAPSDSDDSITLWFPEIGVCVNNLVWPVLYNIFAIRGEAYREPQGMIASIDQIIGLAPDHLLGAHGPPISGADEIRLRTTRYRDSLQFLWDQTVRGLNKGMTADQLAHSVVLPASADDDYLTTEFYGVAEHHVRQIAAGVRGWFDGDTGRLFPMEPVERAGRLVEAMGGAGAVRAVVEAARADNDLRWALELASWLSAREAADEVDRLLLAGVLRDIGYRTKAANIRNWCLTRARDLDGSTDLSRLREHRLRASQLAGMEPRACLHLLRVLLDPDRAAGIDCHIAFRFGEDGQAGLHIRNGVSVLTEGARTLSSLSIAYADLVKVLAGPDSLDAMLASGAAEIHGDVAAVRRALACFDVPGFRT